MISNNALEIRSASSRFSRTEALPGFVLRAPRVAAMQCRTHDRTVARDRAYGLTAAASERAQHVA
jgi:hypothetical protein